MSCSPRGPGSLAPVIPEKLSSQELSASVGAPGPHAFAVRFSALVSRHQSVHRIPLPTSVTIAIRPSCGGGTARTLRLIWVSEKAKYFFGRGWTGGIKNGPSGKSTLRISGTARLHPHRNRIKRSATELLILAVDDANGATLRTQIGTHDREFVCK